MERTPTEILRLVRSHRVCSEVWPSFYHLKSGARLQSGFAVELYGAHASHGHFPIAGDRSCRLVYDDLRLVAELIRPVDTPMVRCVFDDFVPALHHSPRREFRPDVRLTIHVRHGGPFALPVDTHEQRFLARLEARLVDVGVQPGSWLDPKD